MPEGMGADIPSAVRDVIPRVATTDIDSHHTMSDGDREEYDISVSCPDGTTAFGTAIIVQDERVPETRRCSVYLAK